MPTLRVAEVDREPVEICYRIYDEDLTLSNGNSRSKSSVRLQHHDQHSSREDDAKPLVVLIMGFAAGQDAWTPQLHGLLHPAAGARNVRVLTMDNRGVGRSSSPRPRHAYSTSIFAKDVLALMDHLRWGPAHIVGHSMGGMIAMRLALLAPQRVRSLSVLSATGGGWQSLPLSWRATKYMWKAFRADGSKARAKYDLKFHFMQDTLRQYVLGRPRKEMLMEEYTGVPEAGAPPPGQPKWAMKGQLSAIWHHSISSREFEELKRATYSKQVIHGRYDILAAPKHAQKLAHRMGCRFVMLEGAHFITRECGIEINSLLRAIIFPPQTLDLQHYMTTSAESDVVSSLRAPSVNIQDLGKAEVAAAGEYIAAAVSLDGDSPQGSSPTGSSVASNMQLLDGSMRQHTSSQHTLSGVDVRRQSSGDSNGRSLANGGRRK